MDHVGPGTAATATFQPLADRTRAGVHMYFLHDAFGAKELPRALLAPRSRGRTQEFRRFGGTRSTAPTTARTSAA